jgi:hypothetical protein
MSSISLTELAASNKHISNKPALKRRRRIYITLQDFVYHHVYMIIGSILALLLVVIALSIAMTIQMSYSKTVRTESSSFLYRYLAHCANFVFDSSLVCCSFGYFAASYKQTMMPSPHRTIKSLSITATPFVQTVLHASDFRIVFWRTAMRPSVPAMTFMVTLAMDS